MTLKSTYEQTGLHSQKISKATLVQLFEIVRQRITEKITMIKAARQLLDLIHEEGNNYQNKVILCFKSLIEQHPDASFEANWVYLLKTQLIKITFLECYVFKLLASYRIHK